VDKKNQSEGKRDIRFVKPLGGGGASKLKRFLKESITRCKGVVHWGSSSTAGNLNTETRFLGCNQFLFNICREGSIRKEEGDFSTVRPGLYI